jgi:hypothetical protein
MPGSNKMIHVNINRQNGDNVVAGSDTPYILSLQDVKYMMWKDPDNETVVVLKKGVSVFGWEQFICSDSKSNILARITPGTVITPNVIGIEDKDEPTGYKMLDTPEEWLLTLDDVSYLSQLSTDVTKTCIKIRGEIDRDVPKGVKTRRGMRLLDNLDILSDTNIELLMQEGVFGSGDSEFGNAFAGVVYDEDDEDYVAIMSYNTADGIQRFIASSSGLFMIQTQVSTGITGYFQMFNLKPGYVYEDAANNKKNEVELSSSNWWGTIDGNTLGADKLTFGFDKDEVFVKDETDTITAKILRDGTIVSAQIAANVNAIPANSTDYLLIKTVGGVDKYIPLFSAAW